MDLQLPVQNLPENESPKWNRQPSGARSVGNQTTDQSMRELVDLVRKDHADGEKTFPILPTIGTIDGQILAEIDVPFRFNSIVCCAIGGIVAVTHGPLIPDNALVGPNGEKVVGPNSPYNWAFGSNGITPGSSAGANPQPIALFTGPQEIRFSSREQGQKLTFWVHHETNLALRNAIDPAYGQTILVGAVEFLK